MLLKVLNYQGNPNTLMSKPHWYVVVHTYAHTKHTHKCYMRMSEGGLP